MLRLALLCVVIAGSSGCAEPVDTGAPVDDTGGVEPSPSDADGDGTPDASDCAPTDARAAPGAEERCDGLDNDCDGQVDEGFDVDGDGWLFDSADCRAAAGAVDCDDADPAVHPEAEEACNGVDDDCNHTIDDAPDGDADGWSACEDCDDADRYTNPGAPDACDGVDNDCDGAVDPDFDEDGDGVSPCAGDCDDTDPARSGGDAEVCDGVDNDCDDEVDEGFDGDGDGWTTCAGDCDDEDPAVNPGAVELCDGIESDCDAATGDYADGDGDGLSWCDGDCDDTDPDAQPGGEEACDGADNDCDGEVDELPECEGCTVEDPYFYCSTVVSWPSAEEACVGFGGHLVTMDDASENAAVSDRAYTLLGNASWIGYNDRDREGTWTWSSGAAASYTNWYSGEPNDSGGEDCAGTNFGAVRYWNDYPCDTYALPYVCEVP